MVRVGLALAWLLTLAFPTAAGPLAVAGQASAAEDLPIVDVHLHPDPDWDIEELRELLDRVGVIKAGQGSRGPDALALAFATALPARWIPVASGRFNRLVCPERGGAGEEAWELRTKAILQSLDQLEAGLEAGRFRGIGELQVHRNAPPTGDFNCRYPADSPLMQRLWALSATYRVPLFVHMDADDDAVAEMELLLASDRAGTWVWLHAGRGVARPMEVATLRQLLSQHPNLYFELSFRASFYGGRLGTADPIDDGGILHPEWRGLIEDFPERFLLGTDVPVPQYEAAIHFWRGILAQLSPRTAALFAHENATRLLDVD